MDTKVTLLLLGGLISLVSALSGIILQHILAMKKLVAETRQHPFRVVYNKQTEFFDALAPILLDMNSYITTIDVWLGETSNDAPAKVEQAANDNRAVTKLADLLQRYYMYLPERLLKEANQLHSECMFLSSNPNTDDTYKCIREGDVRAEIALRQIEDSSYCDHAEISQIRYVWGYAPSDGVGDRETEDLSR